MNKKALLRELQLKGVRSSGSGGQHVNKVATKIELTFDLEHSNALSANEKERLYKTWKSRLTKNNLLILKSDGNRSQSRNKELAIRRFLKLVEEGLKVPKPRKKTKPSKTAIEKRLRSKKKEGLKKTHRKRVDLD